jgi:hypothetical protein
MALKPDYLLLFSIRKIGPYHSLTAPPPLCARCRYGVQSEMEALLKEKQEVEKALKAKYASLEGACEVNLSTP